MAAIGLVGIVPTAVFAGVGGPSCGDTLTSDTTLTADLDCSLYGGTALFMGRHRIVLDLNGHTVWGWTGADGYIGVDTNAYNHTVVKNGTIANFGIGIQVHESYNTRLRNLTITGEAADISDTAVYAFDHVATVVRNATISGVLTGVWMNQGANALVTGSEITADGTAIYSDVETKNIFSWNVLMGTRGVFAYYANGHRFIGNTANGGEYGFYIDCEEQGRVFVTGNTANDNSLDGFLVDRCYNASSGWAPGTGSRFSANTALGNGNHGFNDNESLNAVWRNNVSKWNGVNGFNMEYPGGVTMTGNVGSRNVADGFYFYENYGQHSVDDFSDNIARRNGSYGMFGEYGVPGTGNIARLNGGKNCYNVLCNE